ncbi:hypothetical protein SELMODRAFT_183426 [Selaginella moellendorffii]|uniref:NADP-dependent oxidoreductase domain-containing protein n=1 Tax=Selaginella moellendorffii TaxID=88036 RepID=D8SWU0_SELML|nr:auxin-induced protein PCNT115 [Selaginella moellendorffii]EFJ11083.1 hypothetical protein SELMODRAFT_183426 [Selaginella moellendorffii]|eukprot:XP_002987780.1 auxin-induced protein PCNT115 [Selaginella moellendorffii]
MGAPRVKLGSQGLEVSRQGLGCMGMSAFYGTRKPESEMIDLIHKAVNDLGITFLDTADVYGPHTNEILVGKAISSLRRESVQVATKFGITSQGIRGDPAYVRESCLGSLERLGVDYIDLYYQHRVDTRVPIEITVGEMKKLVEEGKVKYIGLSEASASDIRRAHAVHPVTAVQLEWSLWTRDVEEDVIPTCRELGIGIVPYSPLGRGFFSIGKKIMEDLPANDFRKVGNDPRLMPEHIDKNAAFYNKLLEMSTSKNCSPGQLALAWLQHQGRDVVPIPGTTKLKNLQENAGALAVELSEQELRAIEDAVPIVSISGERKKDMSLTWRFASSPALEK